MATKRKPIRPNVPSTPSSSSTSASSSSSSFKFRPNVDDISARNEARGTRPTATPTSVKEILTMVVLHVCKKSIFFDTNIKVALYLGSLFIISLIGDFLPFPKTYFSRSDNLFNVYFVKLGWAWTLIFSFPYLLLTSLTICCGDHKRAVKHHLPRLAIATFFWFVWTKLFNVIEATYGRCNNINYLSKSECLKAGYFWRGVDLSGHAFILLYSSLVLIEEARPIINWESIKDLLRNEEHNRMVGDKSETSNPLRNLADEDMKQLKFCYERLTPTIRLLFVGITMLQLLWDIMLVATMLYYHRMVEKFLSGVIAIFTWFFTYRVWYPMKDMLPDQPGKGIFTYQKNITADSQTPVKRNPSFLNQGATGKEIPKFMGRPIYTGNVKPGMTTESNSTPLKYDNVGASRYFANKFDVNS